MQSNNSGLYLKGISGGYDAKYSSNHYYRYNINYAEVEMRDLWQYTLNLTSDEKTILIAHAWELLFTEYRYYFTPPQLRVSYCQNARASIRARLNIK